MRTKKVLIGVKIEQSTLDQLNQLLAVNEFLNKSAILRKALEIGLNQIASDQLQGIEDSQLETSQDDNETIIAYEDDD